MEGKYTIYFVTSQYSFARMAVVKIDIYRPIRFFYAIFYISAFFQTLYVVKNEGLSFYVRLGFPSSNQCTAIHKRYRKLIEQEKPEITIIGQFLWYIQHCTNPPK